MGLGAKEVPDCAWEYFSIVDMMMSCPGLYGMDAQRERAHNDLCKWYRLSKEQTKSVTDNMHLVKDGLDLHLKLKGLQK